jgi:class 3 adenylate cyclase
MHFCCGVDTGHRRGNHGRPLIIRSTRIYGAIGPSRRRSGNRDAQRLFDAQAKAIVAHGGEILKFIGDGLLSIFPIESADKATAAARNALAAAVEAVEAVRGLTSNPLLLSEPPLEIVVALHIGTAIYGNIGAADRLDFTVIGPAVNLVSRIEAVSSARAFMLSVVTRARRNPQSVFDPARSSCCGCGLFPSPAVGGFSPYTRLPTPRPCCVRRNGRGSG